MTYTIAHWPKPLTHDQQHLSKEQQAVIARMRALEEKTKEGSNG